MIHKMISPIERMPYLHPAAELSCATSCGTVCGPAVQTVGELSCATSCGTVCGPAVQTAEEQPSCATSCGTVCGPAVQTADEQPSCATSCGTACGPAAQTTETSSCQTGCMSSLQEMEQILLNRVAQKQEKASGQTSPSSPEQE